MTPQLLTHRKNHLEALILRKEKALQTTMNRRLSLGLTTFAGFGLSQALPGFFIEFVSLFVLLPLYIWTVRRSRQLRRQNLKIRSLVDFYQQRIDLEKAQGKAAANLTSFPNIDLARDLDLHEFLAYVDGTLSRQGESTLKKWLSYPSEISLSLQQRHEALRTMAQAPGLLRRLQILFPMEKLDLDELQKSLAYPFSEGSPTWRWLLPLFWVATAINLYFQQMALAKLSFLLYCGGTLTYLAATKAGFTRAQDILKSLEILEPVFTQLGRWKPQQMPLAPDLTSPAPLGALRDFRRYVALMSLRANPILFYLINFAVPWSLFVMESGEKSRLHLKRSFDTWKDQWVLVDVLGSLANLYIYHTRTLPTVAPGAPLQFRQLRHPLIPKKQAIANDFDQDSSSLFLITGSNMSGKSTFIRAAGLNIVLAQVGAPVFAEEMTCSPAPLVSCIRVSDSLRDGRSYFFSEVQRLKIILEQARQEKVFFLIDEPLRGTNNRERLKGNQAYLNQLVATDSTGFICTHDLELTKLEGEIPGLQNYHFTEVWKEGELVFDYKIHSGPSQSTNALKILQQEGLL